MGPLSDVSRAHGDRLRQGLSTCPRGVALPWVDGPWVHVGGLLGVGFALVEQREVLVIVSHDGQSVVDCLTGDRLARDRDVDGYPRLPDLTVEAIGPLAGRRVPVAGLFGGGLPVVTADGWKVDYWPIDYPSEGWYLNEFQGPGHTDPWDGSRVLLADPPTPGRAWGFSPSGAVVVVALADGAWMWNRVTTSS